MKPFYQKAASPQSLPPAAPNLDTLANQLISSHNFDQIYPYF